MTLVVRVAGGLAQGWVGKSTTSATIRWIRLSYMYSDKSSLSLSVLFASHNMIGWHIFVGLRNSMYRYDKSFYTLAYFFACLVALYVVLLLLRWSSIYWCEHMREVLVVNMKGWFRCIGLWPMYCFGRWYIINYC